MARPKLAPAEKRTESVRISLTPSEKIQLLADAEKASLPPAEFARRAVLGHRFRVVQSHVPGFVVQSEINAIGVNLNQIAKALNSHRMFAPAELAACCSTLDALFKRWIDDNSQGSGQ